MLKTSAVFAVLTGVLLALGEVLANWGDWQWWPWWLVDFVAAALLFIGGTLVLRRSPVGPVVLGIGWAFTAGMIWMSLASNVAQGVDPDRDERLMGGYVLLLAALLTTSVIGTVMTLWGARSQRGA